MRIIYLLIFILSFCATAFSDATVTLDQASDIATDTSNFDNNLSSSDTTVQAALETLDELYGSGSGDITSVGDCLSGACLGIGSTANIEEGLATFTQLNVTSNVDINAGTIDGTKIGFSSPADATFSVTTASKIISTFTQSVVITSLAASDDSFSILGVAYPTTFTDVGLACAGTCTTPAQITLAYTTAGVRKAMTHNVPGAVTSASDVTFTSITANNTVPAGGRVEITVINTPTTGDNYTMILKEKRQ